jgi:hypothetical protein
MLLWVLPTETPGHSHSKEKPRKIPLGLLTRRRKSNHREIDVVFSVRKDYSPRERWYL